MSPFQDYIPADIADLYEIHDYHHAAAILAKEYAEEFADICRALREFKLKKEDITKPGGSESDIPVPHRWENSCLV
jgi:CRISPR-associated protein Csd2